MNEMRKLKMRGELAAIEVCVINNQIADYNRRIAEYLLENKNFEPSYIKFYKDKISEEEERLESVELNVDEAIFYKSLKKYKPFLENISK